MQIGAYRCIWTDKFDLFEYIPHKGKHLKTVIYVRVSAYITVFTYIAFSHLYTIFMNLCNFISQVKGEDHEGNNKRYTLQIHSRRYRADRERTQCIGEEER